MNIKTSKIVSFFSIPNQSLAIHNPSAYHNIMKNIVIQRGRGVGCCDHCGNGIVHHVVIQDENGKEFFIGTSCAEKIGCDKDQLRHRLTDKEIADRNFTNAQRQAYWESKENERKAFSAKRAEEFADIISILHSKNDNFFNSLASQLLEGNLSVSQAYYVCKATSETGRKNKKNSEAWEQIEARCCGWMLTRSEQQKLNEQQ